MRTPSGEALAENVAPGKAGKLVAVQAGIHPATYKRNAFRASKRSHIGDMQPVDSP
jgi:hypothetical protein